MDRFPRARAVIERGLAGRAYPAASIEVGRRDDVLWNDAFGALTYAADAPACTPDTIFDLASLTKVIATTSIAMRHVADGLSLDDPVSRWIAAWHGDDRAAVTVRHLLEHASGLPAHVRFWERHADRQAIHRALVAVPLERPPGSAAVYSDPGFMLLGLLLEARGGAALDAQFAPIARAIGGGITFTPDASLRPRIAPTEIDRWRGRLLQGEVHDENAAALGGVAAHAGLFGTAASVGTFARLVLRTFQEDTPLGTPDTMRLFAAPSRIPDSSRALGWDTMRPTSSCGTKMSPAAIGHTGFTGTSLWIDPERDLYVVWLTNRVHPTRENNQLAALRPVLHDAIGEDVS
jgi:CubicO group peptidase (beta-lactamase class C family)